MKKWIFLALILLLGLSACTRAAEGQPTQPASAPENAETQSQPPSNPSNPDSSTDSNNQTPDTSAVMEETSGPLTARIFSNAETTINQQEYTLQGWVNRAAVISVNDEITTAKAEETFSVGLTLESGPNLVEVVISDEDGNEVTFDITVFVES